MQLPIITVPPPVPVQRERPPKENIPQTRGERERIREQLRDFAAEEKPVPPLGTDELRKLAVKFTQLHEIDGKYVDYVGVLLSNEVWRDQLAAVPFERRLLLLPKCMRIEDQCPAPFDEFGLLCKSCGLCSIQDLQEEAERLGYAVLCAEGSAIVMAIVETGKIEAIVGVSCLSVLEKAFPYMEAAAIPGVAIPLLQDDCKDVTVDLDWIWEVIHLTGDDQTARLNLDTLREGVTEWFERDTLARLMISSGSESESIARDWLAKDGKRWRPFLTACVWKALQDDPTATPTDDVKRLGLAVECFHKASLVHDDIEDADDLRYGEATLHTEHGVPVALNVGDLLLGDGYQLIGGLDADAGTRAECLRVAAAGHRTLCLGQGAELVWTRNPRPLDSKQVLAIFKQKTAPAFEVALQMGAALAGADAATVDVLTRYSENLGIAYQIRDDVDDLAGGDIAPNDLTAMRPSLPLALLSERVRAKKDERAVVERVWRREGSAEDLDEVRRLIDFYEIENRCIVLQESYKEQAVRALADLESASLKGLLRRVVSKIFSVEIKGWCSESEVGDAASREVGAASVG